MDEILNLIESVSEVFLPTLTCIYHEINSEERSFGSKEQIKLKKNTKTDRLKQV